MKILYYYFLFIFLFNALNGNSVTLNGSAAGDRFGFSGTGIGDFNGDGYDDLIVGAPTVNVSKGAAYIYFGPNPVTLTPDITLKGENLDDAFGYSVAGDFDFNGDGLSDVIVGAIGYNNEKGRAYIFLGGCNSPSVIQAVDADVYLDGENAGDRFGSAVSSGGRYVNFDPNNTFDAVMVSSPLADNYSGRVYLYPGRLNPGPTFGPSLIFTNPIVCPGNVPIPNALFGASIAYLGDIDNDKKGDIIIGAPTLGPAGGHVHIYYGRCHTELQRSNTYYGEIINNNDFGGSVSGIGDINGNGTRDFIIGDGIGQNGLGSTPGKAYVYDGGSNPSCSYIAPIIKITGESALNNFGGLSSVAGLGDIDGDGYGDFIAGAYHYPSQNGTVYIFKSGFANLTPGSCCTWPPIIDPVGGGGAQFNINSYSAYTGTGSNDLAGFSVSRTGDINGDGVNDAMFGAYGASSVTGESHLQLGTPGAGFSHGDLNLKALVQGMYGFSQTPNMVKVCLYDCLCNFIDEKNVLLDANGNAVDANGDAFIKFTDLPPLCNQKSYYIVIKSVCSGIITTWSHSCNNLVRRGGPTPSFDFTTGVSQAFGNNQILKNGKATIYSGDINSDFVIDGSDLALAGNDAYNFLTGCCLKADLNGDEFVDASDLVLVNNNAQNFVSGVSPCENPCQQVE